MGAADGAALVGAAVMVDEAAVLVGQEVTAGAVAPADEVGKDEDADEVDMAGVVGVDNNNGDDASKRIHMKADLC
ncbi:hypothetical protein DN068_07300 [Taibaiella soli]|uniref:Uncharacterized protein n=1 Tax=Taibaiella soli TaxID=1649169 RepID=A0A2W2AZR7_9BACT|nr:hypothetical protein DN068_07300 [Taibaiella soli]